jgi:hypothetical protein
LTAQGHPRAIFNRALENGNLVLAEMTARELGRLTLVESLRLTIVYADRDPDKFGRAAARWLARFTAEAGLDPVATQLAPTALTLLPTQERARGCTILAELGRRHGIDLRGLVRKSN